MEFNRRAAVAGAGVVIPTRPSLPRCFSALRRAPRSLARRLPVFGLGVLLPIRISLALALLPGLGAFCRVIRG